MACLVAWAASVGLHAYLLVCLFSGEIAWYYILRNKTSPVQQELSPPDRVVGQEFRHPYTRPLTRLLVMCKGDTAALPACKYLPPRLKLPTPLGDDLERTGSGYCTESLASGPQ